MQAEHEIILTASGLKKIEEDLERLRTVNRRRVAERMRNAIEVSGELTDNSEFEDARNEHAFVEGRIEELKQILAVARVLENEEVQTDEVSIGSVVKVRDIENSDDCEWTIVGTFEADPAENRISNESPVGEALMGKRVGDIAEIEIPAGIVRYEILSISK